MNKLTYYEITPNVENASRCLNPQTFPHLRTHTYRRDHLSYTSKCLHRSPLERQTRLAQLLCILLISIQFECLHRLRQGLLHILLSLFPSFMPILGSERFPSTFAMSASNCCFASNFSWNSLSAALNFSASAIIWLIWLEERRSEFEMTRLADLADRRSLAVTLRIPFASSSNVTSS